MASCSTFSLAPSLPMKIFPYVPPVRKQKPKSKANAKAAAGTAEYNLSEADSFKERGEWFDIDDFPMLDSNASRSLDPGAPAPFRDADPSGSLDQDVVGDLDAAPFPEKLEHCQPGRDSLDEGGTDHATSIAKTNWAMNGLLGGSSRELPLIVESDAAEGNHSATYVEPSNGASDYQENGYRVAAGNQGYRAGQHGHLDAGGARAFSVEDMESIRHDSPLSQDEPLFGDVGVTDGPSATRKRTRPSSVAMMIISPAAVPDVAPEPGLEGPRSAKRRRPAERQVENLILLDPVPTPKSTPLPTPSGKVSRSRASNEPSPGPLNSDSKGDGAGTLRPHSSDLHEEEDSGDSVHSYGTGEELLHSLRGSISPVEGIEGEQDIGLDSDRREENREGSGGEVGQSHEHELNQVNEVSYRPSAKTYQRRKRSDRLVREKGHGPSRTALRPRGSSTMPRRASRQLTSSQPRQRYGPGIDNVTQSRSPRTSSSGTKARDGTNSNHGPSLNLSYQITDLTLCPVPKGSSIVAAIMRCSESNLSLNSIALDGKLLGGEGKLICMKQLSPDSWILLGYRRDDSGSDGCNRESLTLLNADRTSSPFSDTASDDSNHPDDGDEDEESSGEYRPHGAGRGHRLSRGDMRFRKRTRVPWLESDEERLLSYKDKMGMEWNDICKRFPDRSPSAIKLRYYTLRKR